ncbi:hypothetical protein ACHIPZ_01250 [Antrihabitans sp. NCIMB 15449]|jgi:hypothetical protein|uniref:GNAT family N-acetyltransferase n=1 Tax=Antrihabitans spumae TaxID=3373370 RepID=A0ABW7JFX1_9NOCA
MPPAAASKLRSYGVIGPAVVRWSIRMARRRWHTRRAGNIGWAVPQSALSIDGRTATLGELSVDRLATLCNSSDTDTRAVANLYHERPERYPMAYVLLFDDVLGGLVASRIDHGTATAEVDLAVRSDDLSAAVVEYVALQIVPVLTGRFRTLRRISCAVRLDDELSAKGLSAAGFVSEGWAPPYLWDVVETPHPEDTHREMWTYFVPSPDISA